MLPCRSPYQSLQRRTRRIHVAGPRVNGAVLVDSFSLDCQPLLSRAPLTCLRGLPKMATRIDSAQGVFLGIQSQKIKT